MHIVKMFSFFIQLFFNCITLNDKKTAEIITQGLRLLTEEGASTLKFFNMEINAKE